MEEHIVQDTLIHRHKLTKIIWGNEIMEISASDNVAEK